MWAAANVFSMVHNNISFNHETDQLPMSWLQGWLGEEKNTSGSKEKL